MSTPRLIFRIFYSLIYTFFCLLLAALILITPADAVVQAIRGTFTYNNVVIICIVYLVTTLVVLFVYSLRLYITRTVLAGIPKQWIPIGKGDVRKDVRNMIIRDIGRSAAIAYAARPKIGDHDWHDWNKGDGLLTVPSISTFLPGPSLKLVKKPVSKTSNIEDDMGIALPPTLPVWGNVDHPGWGSPNSPDLRNVQYGTVLDELPNLIEAKAVSLAPPDLEAGGIGAGATLNMEAVDVLGRSLNMSMRDYVVHLTGLDVLPSASTDEQPGITRDISEFLDTYERARFSGRPMTSDRFRRLMQLFAELLRAMRPLDPAVLDTLDQMGSVDMYSGSDESGGNIDDDAPRDTRTASLISGQSSARNFSDRWSFSSSTGSKASNLGKIDKHRQRRPSLLPRNSSYGTAPTTPKSTRNSGLSISNRPAMERNPSTKSDSTDTCAQTRRPFGASTFSSDVNSLSGGSVIRLARREDQLSGVDLPYVLSVGEMV
ncbi:uncharacterized protein BCR38DRAFT_349929 [Pseudomassariella vexata]|uniref:Defect at low temperature protein 1 n=1 Tax=Pseudomassariella vexata TaxID=1141098 RepID=A0A1Y2DL21_9PEZI|nr:uncharacterized protein BCR38DRAFT_349929 [Pseudomassariella vexata]ORY59998.1 hypothetical protein BCR38DRAFT_349929 [Pseudomassariella vexata]